MNLVTPTGFRDILSDEATERERIQRSVQELFASCGYVPIETPTLEVMDVVNKGVHLPTSPFKFFDSQGDLLAMRPDVTLQVARMYATRLQKDSSPKRYRYTQRVFREIDGEAQATAREITQIGVECIGESGRKIDSEIIELFIRALHLSGVSSITLAIATVAPLRALLERSGGGDSWRSAVLDAFHRSDFVELDRLCDLSTCDIEDAQGVAPAYAQTISKLARIRGGIDAIEIARSITSSLGCSDGLDELEMICNSLINNSFEADFLVDFSVMSSFDYYTGVVFEAYSPYLGTSLGSGGRYDRMLSAYGCDVSAAGFAFCLENVMAASNAEMDFAQKVIDDAEDIAIADAIGERGSNNEVVEQLKPLKIAIPKGSLNAQTIECLNEVGFDTGQLDDPGRALVIETTSAHYFIVRPSDAPAFVAYGAADCGICGKDSLLESQAQVVELVDLGFGGCKFVVAEPRGSSPQIEQRYRKLGSIRVATKYPNITLAYYAKTGIQVDIVKLHGNIELAPLSGMAERIVDITATGTTLRENDLVIVDEILDSTARFFANPCSLRTDERVQSLAKNLKEAAKDKEYAPIAGRS